MRLAPEQNTHTSKHTEGMAGRAWCGVVVGLNATHMQKRHREKMSTNKNRGKCKGGIEKDTVTRTQSKEEDRDTRRISEGLYLMVHRWCFGPNIQQTHIHIVTNRDKRLTTFDTVVSAGISDFCLIQQQP